MTSIAPTVAIGFNLNAANADDDGVLGPLRLGHQERRQRGGFVDLDGEPHQRRQPVPGVVAGRAQPQDLLERLVAAERRRQPAQAVLVPDGERRPFGVAADPREARLDIGGEPRPLRGRGGGPPPSVVAVASFTLCAPRLCRLPTTAVTRLPLVTRCDAFFQMSRET